MTEPTKNAGASTPGEAPKSNLRPPWKPGQSGNPKGREKGMRNKATLAAQELLDGEAEGLTRKAVELALAGDTTALRLCLERIAPPRKDAPLKVDLPELHTAADAVVGISAIISAVALGRLTPAEGAAMTGLIEAHRRTLEVSELEARLAAMEERMEKGA